MKEITSGVPLPRKELDNGMGGSVLSGVSKDIGSLNVHADILSEIAADLDIKDVDLLQEVLSDISKGEVSKSSMNMETHTVHEYRPNDFQHIAIRRYNGSENVYEAKEPSLEGKRRKAIELVKNVFDRFIGVEDSVVASDPASRREYLWNKFNEITKLYNLKLSEEDSQVVFYYIERDFLKYGLLDAIMNDRHIEDVSCNGPNQPIYIYHRDYGSIRSNVQFNESELNEFILRLSQLCGKHISILNPIMDAALPEGSRINMTLGSEVTKKGSTFTIRKFKKVPISPVELMGFGSIDARMLAYLWMMIDYNRSFLVSGGTASGKTTLLNAVCMFIRPQYKVVSIEDTPEINLEHPNWLQAVSRTGFGGRQGGSSGPMPSGISSSTGAGNIGLYDLLVAALRQRPEYILVGEVRGSEAFTMFQAIAVGHACMGTIHARNMTELIGRIESVPMNVPRTLFSNVDLVVFQAQIKEGDKTKRRIMEIVEVLELEPENKALITNPSFKWNPKTDKFEAGRFMLFEKIATEFGLPIKTLMDEYHKRVKLLDWLKDSGTKNHIDFTKRIVSYSAGQLKDF